MFRTLIPRLMVRILNVILIVAVELLLTACTGRSRTIEINKNKIGGLYETNENGKEFKFYDSDESFKLDTMTFISFAYFDRIQREKSPYQGAYSLSFSLNDKGTLRFNEMTGRNIKKQICLVVGDEVVAAPIVQSVIPNGQVSIIVADEKGIEEILEFLGK